MEVLKRMAALLNSIAGGAKNYVFTDEEGTVLFETEREDSRLETGDSASPDGTFTLQDGRIVTISDGYIVEIAEVKSDGSTDLVAENAALTAQVAALTAENKALSEGLTTLLDKVEVMNKAYATRPASTHVPANRTANPKTASPSKPDAAALKAEMAEKRDKLKNDAMPLGKRKGGAV